tara:strand:+ start:1013 stop:1957 length:945 start_codon:yes stop_codon:yes gene_type:complete
MNKSNPFISVDYWLTRADVIIDSNCKNKTQNYSYDKELKEMYEKKECPIILVKTDLLGEYIDKLLNLQKNFKLITTSNDDQCIPYMSVPHKNNSLKEKADKLLQKKELKMWYCKNPGINHNKIIGYPLGPKWQWKTTRFFGEPKRKHMRIYNKLCTEPLTKLLNKNNEKTELLYFNFNEKTTNEPLYSPHKNIRKKVKNRFLKLGYTWNAKQPFEKYMETLCNHKFCISPPGRGIDTHRTWEALMMGTIPIVESTTLDHLFDNLPCIIIKDEKEYETLTPDKLNNIYNNILEKAKKNEYRFDIMYTPYWDKVLK